MEAHRKTHRSLSIKRHLCLYSMHTPLAADPVLYSVENKFKKKRVHHNISKNLHLNLRHLLWLHNVMYMLLISIDVKCSEYTTAPKYRCRFKYFMVLWTATFLLFIIIFFMVNCHLYSCLLFTCNILSIATLTANFVYFFNFIHNIFFNYMYWIKKTLKASTVDGLLQCFSLQCLPFPGLFE